MYLYFSYLRLRGSHRDCLLQGGFSIGRGRPRSPSIEPDYDEDDEWWNNIAEESKESVPTIPVMTSNETNQRVALSDEASGSNADTADAPQDDRRGTSLSASRVALSDKASGSNADTADAPQGNHRGTSSSSSGVERSGEASGSNAVTTDAPDGEASGSNAGAPGAPQDDHRSTMSTSTPMVVEIVPPSEREQQRRERITAAIVEQQDVIRARIENDQFLSLQSELAEARRQNTQLQQLLEEDSERHPSNKQAKATQSSLTKVRKE